MATRLHAGSIWREGTSLRALDSPLQTLRPLRSARQLPRVRTFSSFGTPSRQNASSIASSSSTTLDSLATQTSDTSISIFEPLTPYIYQLPELLHLPPSAHSYAISIIAATVVIRTCITLPVSLWQRARMRRLEEVVAPRWEIMKKELPITVAKRSRREKKSYKEYEAALKREVKMQIRALTKQHKCAPFYSIAVPLLVHIPIFISFSFLLRTALAASGSPISLETIPWWSPEPGLQEKFAANAMVLAERGIEGEALVKLTTIQGPTLNEVDKTMIAPIGLGVLTMANVELGQWVKRGMTSEEEEAEKLLAKSKEKAKEEEMLELGSFRKGSRLANILRSLAIGFVIISSQTPAVSSSESSLDYIFADRFTQGVVIYWLTSATYTLAQTSVFAYLDRQRIKNRVVIKN